MARIKQKPIVALDWNSSARSNSNPTTPSALPAPRSNVLLQKPTQQSQTANSISLPDPPSVHQVSPQQPQSFSAVLQSSDSRLAPTEKILRCDICNETFPGSHLQPFRDHVEKCHADTTAGLDNDSDEGSPTDRLTTPPESERSETDRIPLPPAYSSTEVQLYPKIHDEDDEPEETQQPQQRFRLPALTSISEYQDSLDAGEDGSLEDHARVLVNAHDALVKIQDEYLSLDRAAKTSQYPPTLSIEDEFDMIGGRVRGVLRETIKPSMKVVNPRAKPVRSDDPEKWYPTNQFQLDQDRIEGAVYGYITKEGARDIGHQDPIGQRARGPGENRDLRARQPMRNAVRDDDSGDESGLNAVDAALLEGGRGKREKRPSNRVIGTNSRASSVDARAKPARKNAKSRLADLGADHPSAAETLDSTNRWVDDVDADDGSGASDEESGVAKPHEGPQQSYLDPKTKKNATGKKNKNVSNNGELDDEDAAAAKAARSQKRSEGAKMGWAKRKEALAAKESTQASVNGDLDEGSQSELAKPEPNDASDAGSNLKVAPKKKVKQMIQLADGTWIEKPSAATINMRRRWQKKREAEAKGLPPPKIGRYKKTDIILAESSSTPADFNDQENDQLLAAVDGAAANNERKNELNDEDGNDADKTTKGKKKQRRNKQELSAAMVLDDDNDTVNDDTLMDEENEEPTSVKKKRQADDDLAGPPRKKINTQRNTESLVSDDEEDEVTEDEMLLDASSSPRKRADNGGHKKKMRKENEKKGTHIRFSQRKAELQGLFVFQQKPALVVPPQDLIVFMADGGRAPPLGRFNRRPSAGNGNGNGNGNAPNPVAPGAAVGGDEDEDVDMDMDMDTETDVEGPVQRAGSARVPSGIRAPPLGPPVVNPEETAGSYYDFMGAVRPPPQPNALVRPGGPDCFASQRSVIFRGPPRGSFSTMRPPPARFTEFEELYTPLRPHPDPYHRSDPPNPNARPGSSSGSEFASDAPAETGLIPRLVVSTRSVSVDRPKYPVNTIRPRPDLDIPGLQAAVDSANAMVAGDSALQGTALRRTVPVPVDRTVPATQSHLAPRIGNQDPEARGERRSRRERRAPARNDMVESSAIPSSSPPFPRSRISVPTSRPRRPRLPENRIPARPPLERCTESEYGFEANQPVAGRPGDLFSEGTRSTTQPEVVASQYEDNGVTNNRPDDRVDNDNLPVPRGIPFRPAAMGFGDQGPATFPPDFAQAASRMDNFVAEPSRRGPATLPPFFAEVPAAGASAQSDEVDRTEINAMVCTSLAGVPGMEPMGGPRKRGNPVSDKFSQAAARHFREDEAVEQTIERERRQRAHLANLGVRLAARQAVQESQTASARRTPAPVRSRSSARPSPRQSAVPELAHGDRSSAETQGPATPAQHASRIKQEPREPRKSAPNSSGPEVLFGSGIYKQGYIWAATPAAEEQKYPKLDKKGVAIKGSYKPVEGKRERKPTRRLEDETAQSSVTRLVKRVSDSKESGQTKRARTSTAAIEGDGSAALPDRTRTQTPARQPSQCPFSSRFPGLVNSDMRRREHTPQEADRGSLDPSNTKASGKGKGKGKAKSSTEGAITSARPSQTLSRETPAPRQQTAAEEESVTTSGRKSKRSTQGKPPKRLDDEGDHAEEERQTRSPPGHNRTGQANQRMEMDATGISYEEPGLMSFTNPNSTEHRAPAPGSATKKNTKGKAPRKSESKDTEADSPVASIEDGAEMTSSQKTVIDPEVVEAMRKREEARKAKSEKMKAITKARWASGEMHTVMEKKKANNALKKAALNAGGSAPIAIAPAPVAIAPAKAAPTVMGGIGEKVKGKGKGSVSQSPAPVTPTLGSFSGKGRAKTTAKAESKKEPRTKQLAKSETATSSRRSLSRGLSNEMDGANSEDDHDSDEDTGKPRKLTEYEMFLQISTPGAAATSDSDGRPTRARSIAGVYEGRRSGRGGSFGAVGMERNNSDDGTEVIAARGTPASVGGARKGKGVSKLSLYDQFQLLSSPTSAGSPAPRGRRPAALRAKQTFQSFGQDDEVEEEERVAYAGPPVHLGHSRNNSGVSISSSVKKDTKQKSKPMGPPKMAKVKKEEVDLGDEEDRESEEEEDSEEEGPKKKSAYDMWQDIINNGGEVPEGEKRKRATARKSDICGK